MGKWVFRGLLETIRVVVIVIWSVVGLFFWIPFLARMTIFFTVMVLMSVTRGTGIRAAEYGLDRAVRFYINGFEKINAGIRNIIDGVDDVKEPTKVDRESIQHMVIQAAITIVFWVVVGLLAGIVAVPKFAATPIAGSSPNNVQAPSQGAPEVVPNASALPVSGTDDLGTEVTSEKERDQ